MGEVTVFYGEDARATAILLLGTAEGLELGQEVVRTIQGAFVVPSEVADAAGLGKAPKGESAADKLPTEDQPPPRPTPAKKAVAKKTATKRASAKKAVAKKTAKKTQE